MDMDPLSGKQKSNINISSSEKVFEFDEGLTAVVDFQENIKAVHPAIDVVNGKAYVGVFLDTTFYKKKKKRKRDEEEVEIIVKPALYLVTSDRKLIPAYDVKTLLDLKLRLAYKPLQFEARWSKEDIQAFLEGKLNVTPKEVFLEVFNTWREHIDFPNFLDYFYHGFWSVGTFFAYLFNTYGYDYVGGVKRAGKTKVLMMLAALCFNAFFSMNMSIASLYRLIQNARGTLLIDENEKLKNPDRALEFRSLLLAGYKKGAKVYRVEKTRREKQVPVAFDVYSPKALANIGGLEDVLEDRCKVTIMKRTKNRKVANKEVDLNDLRWMKLRGKLYALYLIYWSEVKECYDKLCELSEHDELVNYLSEQTNIPSELVNMIGSRDLELWKPIFALAMFFDKYCELSELSVQVNLLEIKQKILSTIKSSVVTNKFTNSLSSPSSLLELMVLHAIESSYERQIENITETGECILAKALVELVKEDGYYKVKDIRLKMESYFDEEQKWLKNRWVGRALRRLGFTNKRRVGTGYEYYLTVDAVKDLCERLGVEVTVKPEDKQRDKQQGLDSPTVSNNYDFSSIKQQLYNFVKNHGPVTLDQAIKFLESQGLQEEEGYKLIDKLMEEGKIKQVEDKVGNVHFIVSLESGKELLKNEKLMLSVMSNGEKAGFKAWQWGDLEIKGKEMGLTEEEVNKALEGLKKKGWITDFIKNNVTYFKLLKATSKPSFNKNMGENRSL